MKRLVRAAAVGAAVAVGGALALGLIPPCDPGPAKVRGSPARPTFAFGRPFVLRNFVLMAYDDAPPSPAERGLRTLRDDRWSAVWGITAPLDPGEVVREVEYGVLPKGYSEYVPLRQTMLRPNTLYTFHFEGAAVRADGTFAVVDRSGTPTIVMFERSKSSAEVLAELEALVHPAPR